MIRILYAVQAFVGFALRTVLGVGRFAYGLIPCGSIFGVPGAIIKPFVFLMFLLALLGSCTNRHCRRVQSAAPSATGESAVGLEPVSGRTRYYTGERAEAVLRVKAVGLNCLVEMSDARSQGKVLDVYVKAGRTEDVQVPAGRFAIRYQAGLRWTGGTQPFGSGTRHSCEPAREATFERGSTVMLTVGDGR